MKAIIQNIIKYSIWAFIFTASSFAYAAWSEPTGTPPSNNVDAPINIASTSQTKAGFLWAGGLGSTAGGYFATTLGVATTTNPATLGLSALFNSSIGASEYCDQSNTHCISPSESGKVVYIAPSYIGVNTYYYALTQNATGYAGEGSATTIFNFTKSQLAANIPAIANETRDIAGIIIQYQSSLFGSGANAQELEYVHTIETYIDQGVGRDSLDSKFFYYSETSQGYSSTGVYGNNVVVMDYGNDDDYPVIVSVSRKGTGALSGTTRLGSKISIIGYIVR